MPPLSNWNTPLVSPRQSRAKVSASSSGKRVGIDPLAGGLLDQLDDLGEDGQVAQAEEVHLQQAGPLHVGHRPLGDDFLLVLHVLQGDVVGQRAVGDDHGGGVGADVAGQALDPHGQVQQLADLQVGLVELLQVVALFQGVGEGDLQFLGHQGHDGVDPRDGQAQRAAHVADRRPGRQRAEGADLRHVLHAVLLLDVLDHLAAALLAEVDVDVGRLAAALVQEALEEQVVLQRADVAEVQGVGDQRAHARAAGRGLDALGAGEAHEVPDDEKVVGETRACRSRPARAPAAPSPRPRAGRRASARGLPA